MTVVSDSSPLIALDRIGRLGLLSQLYPLVVIPLAVRSEVFMARSVPIPGWIQVRALAQAIPPSVRAADLGDGETEAISLALEMHATLLILDDRAARTLAKELGLRVTGVGGVLLAAKQAGALPLVTPLVEELVAAGFHISIPVREELRRLAGA